MNEQPFIFNPPRVSWELVRALSKIHFSSTEILITLFCLSELDSAGCLKPTISEIAFSLNVSTRTVHYAMEKFKLFGVEKDENQRYPFSELVKALTELCNS